MSMTKQFVYYLSFLFCLSSSTKLLSISLVSFRDSNLYSKVSSCIQIHRTSCTHSHTLWRCPEFVTHTTEQFCTLNSHRPWHCVFGRPTKDLIPTLPGKYQPTPYNSTPGWHYQSPHHPSHPITHLLSPHTPGKDATLSMNRTRTGVPRSTTSCIPPIPVTARLLSTPTPIPLRRSTRIRKPPSWLLHKNFSHQLSGLALYQ